MQLLHLRIKNLNSLKGEHHIDFVNGPLGATGLFAITGPTGAGKSTILDAITLALYNQTPRSGSVSKNDIARLGSIITRNTEEAWAQLDYRTKGVTYRSHWGISVNRNGNLRDYSLVLSRQEPDETFVALDVKRNEVPRHNAQLIGLNFDQFLRSILLSQGDFARFLKSNANERGELLEKITGTEIYREIGKTCFERQKAENDVLRQLQLQLEGIELLPEEQVLLLEKELLEIDGSTKDQRQHIDELRNQQRLMEEYTQVKNDVGLTEEKLMAVKQQKEAFEPDQKRLQQHLKVLPLKADIVAIQGQRNLLQDKRKEFKTNEEQLAAYTHEQSTLNEEKADLSQLIEQHKVREEELRPIIKQVRLLDEAIRLENSSLLRLKKTADEEGKLIDSLHKELKEQDAKLEQLEVTQKELHTFIDSNKQLERLAEQLPLIKQTSEVVLSLQKVAESKQQELEPSPTKQQLESVRHVAEKKEILSKAIEQSQAFIVDKKQLLGSQLNDKEQLYETLKIVQQKDRALEKALELEKSREEMKKEQQDLSVTLDKASKELLMNENKLQVIDKAQLINIKHIEELKARRERELLEAKYDEARKRLKPEEACPLCGSLEHPYVEHYTVNSNETETKLAKRNEEQLNLKNEEKQLIAEVSRLKSSIIAYKQQIEQVGLKAAEYSRTIEGLVKDMEIKLSTISQKTIQEEKEHLTKQLIEVEQTIRLVEQFNTAVSRSKDFQNLLEQLENFSSEQFKLDQFLKQYNIDDRQVSSNQLIQLLEQKLQRYQSKHEALQANEKQLLQLKVSRDEKGAQLKKTMGRFAELDKELEMAEKAVKTKHAERDNLFGKRLPDEAEQELKQQAEQVANRSNELNVRLKENSTLIATLTKRQEVLGAQVQTDEQRLMSDSNALLKRLEAHNLASIDAALNSLLAEQEVQQLESRQKEITATENRLEHLLKDHKARLSKLEEKARELPGKEVIVEALRAKELLLNEALGKAGALSERVKADKSNKAKHKEKALLIEKQEQVVNRWNDLTLLIGDATGNKFARFAQELTLKQVLQLANQHLGTLSDRYKVKYIKNDNLDDLFVVDLYHGNAERSVKTLSGGESFLVSLALALGLSDLAGQNTVIGSLFIDEGFGTLDQNTLDLALSALERLQLETNRTIGIISHVPALKERVTTQIELQKDAAGYSTFMVRS
ncbi:AAA family ATPase [Carboxylicivirga sediminis]|uniref:AAA family ATPase n=1 Tax=Carboxylicivirga sediminis TaxID=2006564 RepID=A0A941F5Y8_9BACT|nr:AAA family ATPase [Carboxylicivirga sediminis]MBR8537441.1 AAA family ATPase [Carboxylicivirga sediminis]